ncbi:MAG: SPFH domain-containing protein, partial [Thermoactinomyces sp.]
MKEKDMFKLNGFIGLFIELILVIGIVLSLRSFILNGQTTAIILGIVLLFVFLLLATGFSIIQPNQAKV